MTGLKQQGSGRFSRSWHPLFDEFLSSQLHETENPTQTSNWLKQKAGRPLSARVTERSGETARPRTGLPLCFSSVGPQAPHCLRALHAHRRCLISAYCGHKNGPSSSKHHTLSPRHRGLDRGSSSKTVIGVFLEHLSHVLSLEMGWGLLNYS